MVRALTPPAQTSIDTLKAVEPIIVIEIQWGGSIGTLTYADKGLILKSAQGRIVSFSTISIEQKEDNSGTLVQANITLDDTINALPTLKTVIESVVAEGVPATVFQHFEGNDETDLIPVFKGKISSPIVWLEGERTLSFDLVSSIESQALGNALDTGVCNEAIGQPWPLVFGTGVLVEALRVQCAPHGHLLTPAQDTDVSFKVDDGNDFPQSTAIELWVGGAIYQGSFSGQVFTVTAANIPLYEDITILTRPNVVADPDAADPSIFYANTGGKNLTGMWVFIEGGPGAISPSVIGVPSPKKTFRGRSSSANMLKVDSRYSSGRDETWWSWTWLKKDSSPVFGCVITPGAWFSVWSRSPSFQVHCAPDSRHFSSTTARSSVRKNVCQGTSRFGMKLRTYLSPLVWNLSRSSGLRSP